MEAILEKVEPKKQNFKYDPKMFGLGQNDKPKQEQKEEHEDKKKVAQFPLFRSLILTSIQMTKKHNKY